MFLALWLLAPSVGMTGPLVLEESTRIPRPDPNYDWPIRDIATIDHDRSRRCSTIIGASAGSATSGQA
jgi:hypothetical protein